jgi:integrase
MISLMYRSGLRVGELPWIDLADVFETDAGLRVIRLHDDHVKGGRGRDVLVLDETWRLVRRYLRDRGMAPGPLFRGRAAHTRDRHRRLSVDAIKSVVKRASTATGVAVSPHQFRRGWTASAIRAGVDGAALQVQGGWRDDRMPRRYLADEERAASLDRYAAAMGVTRTAGRADELAARRGRSG